MDTRVRAAASRASPPADALDFLLSEHARHREMCRLLERLADAPMFDAKEVSNLAEFIRVDLSMHIFDEEEDFFPLLRSYCMPEDEIGVALDRLDREHAEDLDLCAQVRVALLTAVSEGKPPSAIPGAPEAFRAFAHSQRRHMTLENAVLIPMARLRLPAEAIEALGVRFAARRWREPPAG